MSIYHEKAKELGELILKSEYAINLADATAEFNNNEESKKKFEEYKAYQENIQNSMRENKMTQEEFKIASKNLAQMALEIKQDPNTVVLNMAENEFHNFVNDIMNVIKNTIMGKSTENASNSNCPSSGCGGCKGC